MKSNQRKSQNWVSIIMNMLWVLADNWYSLLTCWAQVNQNGLAHFLPLSPVALPKIKWPSFTVSLKKSWNVTLSENCFYSSNLLTNQNSSRMDSLNTFQLLMTTNWQNFYMCTPKFTTFYFPLISEMTLKSKLSYKNWWIKSPIFSHLI